MNDHKRILLIIGGGIAAYKSLLLIRLLKKAGVAVKVILTRGGAEFVTPLSISGLSGEKTYQELFDLTSEVEMGHIELSRWADLIVVCPATADLMAKAAAGLAGDLASTTLLATDKPVLMVPAMNVRMWTHRATQRNLATLRADGVSVLDPDEGTMACGEFGPGRLPEPEAIFDAITAKLEPKRPSSNALMGKHILITAGPTREPLDPVRYLSNHSSGKQGYAIAQAAAHAGARVTLVSGPVNLPTPKGVDVKRVQTAIEMLAACQAALPADSFIAVAAVADWRAESIAPRKMKLKESGQTSGPDLKFVENPDILATISKMDKGRPDIIVGFAAETHDVLENAKAKLKRKGCDWIVANDVSGDVMGGDMNAAILVKPDGQTEWPRMCKRVIAENLIDALASHFENKG